MAGALSGSSGAADSASRLVTVLLTLMDGAGGAGPGVLSGCLLWVLIIILLAVMVCFGVVKCSHSWMARVEQGQVC